MTYWLRRTIEAQCRRWARRPAFVARSRHGGRLRAGAQPSGFAEITAEPRLDGYGFPMMWRCA
jgi:hypothetical protein